MSSGDWHLRPRLAHLKDVRWKTVFRVILWSPRRRNQEPKAARGQDRAYSLKLPTRPELDQTRKAASRCAATALMLDPRTALQLLD